MKIGIDGRDIGKKFLTGTGRFTYNLIKALSKDESGNEYIVYFNQYSGLNSVPHNISVRSIKEGNTVIWDQFKLAGHIKKDRIDIFFSPYYKIPVASRCLKIITIHDTINIEKKKSVRKTHKFFTDKADRIATVSEYSKQEIIKNLAIDENKIFVINQAISESFFPREKEAIKDKVKKYGIRDKYILFVGNFSPHKNLKILVEAYKNIKKELIKEYQLIIVAKKPPGYSGEYEKEEGVKIIDFVEENDFPFLYSGASLFIFPSLKEGFGLPPLEAMACGCPVLSSDIPTSRDNLGNAAMFFDPYDKQMFSDKIEEFLISGESEKLKTKGLERVKLFTYERMSKDFKTILRGINDSSR